MWEDDVLFSSGDRKSPANADMMVSDAQANYIVFGACAKQHIASVRQPLPNEEKDPSWQPLPESLRKAEKLREEKRRRKKSQDS
jgi:hypothetical protein